MALLLDTGLLYAYYDRRDHWHVAARQLLVQEAGVLVVPSPVIPEVDYLLSARIGSSAQFAFYRGIIQGGFRVADLPLESYPRVLEINDQYRDLRLGFVNAAILTLAEHLGVGRIATTDRRHFGPVKVAVPLELYPAEPLPS